MPIRWRRSIGRVDTARQANQQGQATTGRKGERPAALIGRAVKARGDQMLLASHDCYHSFDRLPSGSRRVGSAGVYDVPPPRISAYARRLCLLGSGRSRMPTHHCFIWCVIRGDIVSLYVHAIDEYRVQGSAQYDRCVLIQEPLIHTLNLLHSSFVFYAPFG